MSRSFSSAGAVLVLSLGCVPASGRDLVRAVRSTPLNPPSDPVERDTLPLVVDWPAGLEGRIAAGIQAGVPFGRGTLRAPQHARLLGPDGKEMPCQVNVLSTWDHGQSIKWLEVKFLATREHSDGYRIEFGTAVRPKSFPPLETHESPDEIRVDTGSIVVQVGRTTGDLVTAVRAGGSTRDFLGEPIRGFVVDQDDRTYWTSSHGRDVVVEQTGPVCAVIQVSGWYASDNDEPLNRYVARLFLWTGLETVHLQHTFINTGDCDHYQYRAIGLQTRAAMAKVHGVALGGPDAKPLAVELAPHERIALVQQDSSRWASLLGGQREEIDGHLGNSLRIEGEGPTLTAGLRWLWQQHPSGFEVDRTGQIRIHFWSPHAGKLLDLRPAEYLKNLSPTAYETFRLQTKDFSRMHELLPEDGGTRHPTGIGLGKTHDVFFHFSGDSRDLAPEDPLARNRAVLADHPPYAFADPARACQTLVQGRVHPKDTKRFQDVEAMLDAYVQGLYTMRTWDRGFGDGHGFFDFGDTPHQRAHYFHRFWSHMFYVGPASYWKLWFRAGDRLIYEFALANTRHCSDLDTGHHTPAPDGHGRNRAGGTTSDDSGLFHDEDDAPIDLDLLVVGPTRAPPLDETRLPRIVLQDPRGRIIDTRPYPGAKEDALFARGGWTESFSLEPDGETGIYVLRLLDMPGPRDESEPMRHDESMISAWMQVTSWTRHRMMARVRPDGVSPGGRYAFGQYDLYVPPATERIRIRVQANTHTSGETVLRLVAPDSSVAAETPIPPQPPYGMAWFSVEAAPRSDQCGQVWTVDLPDLGEMRRVEIEGVPPYLAPAGQGFAIRSVPMP